MIDLRRLAKLVEDHGDLLDAPVAPFRLSTPTSSREVDTDVEPAIMGVVNLSKDSWYRESVAIGTDAALRLGRLQVAQGAHFIDVGAESIQDYAEDVAAEQQVEQLVPVIEGLTQDGIVVSVEAYHPSVVKASFEAGARVLNLTGSGHDEEMFALAAQYDASVILCHVGGTHPRDLDPDADPGADPIAHMTPQFEARIAAARAAGVTSISLDPGIGFGFRWAPTMDARVAYQSHVLLETFRLRALGLPLCHALPAARHLWGEEVRSAEHFFAVLAHLGRTGIYRVHEVPRVAAALRTLHTL
ncbi:dihydropteroate synthase [uncultured Nocardioides sp.]|uniref:dihydropteroate synthase n=1 Tax=uncultured Nocardioides sp. TaxID=198441 RepID=UPI0026055BB9|nr:dihydropteroate synthase [uncultured Nocardioides sp.]